MRFLVSVTLDRDESARVRKAANHSRLARISDTRCPEEFRPSGRAWDPSVDHLLARLASAGTLAPRQLDSLLWLLGEMRTVALRRWDPETLERLPGEEWVTGPESMPEHLRAQLAEIEDAQHVLAVARTFRDELDADALTYHPSATEDAARAFSRSPAVVVL